MVVQKTINNLKERPHNERKAVAGGIAIFVIVVLLIVWGVFFLKSIQSGTQDINFDLGAQSEFNPSNVRAAQATIEAQGQSGSDLEELYRLRNDAASNEMQIQTAPIGGGSQDPFGNGASY